MNKMRNRKGFTLIEMLIVVAIIAILVAISIPLVNSALEKARDATDKANMRSAAALAQIKYLSEDASGCYYYKVDETNGSQGTLIDVSDTENTLDKAYKGKCQGHKGQYIIITVKGDGTIETEWKNEVG